MSDTTSPSLNSVMAFPCLRMKDLFTSMSLENVRTPSTRSPFATFTLLPFVSSC